MKFPNKLPAVAHKFQLKVSTCNSGLSLPKLCHRAFVLFEKDLQVAIKLDTSQHLSEGGCLMMSSSLLSYKDFLPAS